MQSALITGATSGIGRAVAEMLLERGVVVVATGRNEAELAALARKGAHVGAFDLRLPDAPAALFSFALAALGGCPDFVISNAGFNSRKASLVDVTESEFDEQYAVNLRAPMILGKLALQHMTPRGSGHILLVGSTVVHIGCEKMGAYSAMKAGLMGFARVLVKEARPAGVKVTLAHPGGTDSGFRSEARPDYMQPASVAAMIEHCLFAPADVVVHEITFRPLVETNF